MRRGVVIHRALQDSLQRVSADSALQTAWSEAATHDRLDDIVRLGADAGFTFTVEDLKQAWKEQVAELSEEDLAKISGGDLWSFLGRSNLSTGGDRAAYGTVGVRGAGLIVAPTPGPGH